MLWQYGSEAIEIMHSGYAEAKKPLLFNGAIIYLSIDVKSAIIMEESKFSGLIAFLLKIPAIEKGIGSGTFESGIWWVKFSIDINHSLAWHTIQEIGHVVNYISLNERLPTVFYPVSPAPYMNGGPEDFLSWVIESKEKEFSPDDLKNWLETRLPNPVDDLSSWILDDNDEDE